jgi:hypothetical protein
MPLSAARKVLKSANRFIAEMLETFTFGSKLFQTLDKKRLH